MNNITPNEFQKKIEVVEQNVSLDYRTKNTIKRIATLKEDGRTVSVRRERISLIMAICALLDVRIIVEGMVCLRHNCHEVRPKSLSDYRYEHEARSIAR